MGGCQGLRGGKDGEPLFHGSRVLLWRVTIFCNYIEMVAAQQCQCQCQLGSHSHLDEDTGFPVFLNRFRRYSLPLEQPNAGPDKINAIIRERAELSE